MPEHIQKNTLCDLFAAQGIIAVSAAVLVLVLHLFLPEDCRALLAALHRTAENSPTVPGLLRQLRSALTAWFASGSAA